MSDDLGFVHEHGEIAWNNFLAQHVGKQQTEDFVRAFYDPLNTLDIALQEMYVKRWIETAEGSALDGCGNIVGLSRNIPNAVFIPFFGFVTQPSGRAFGVARMRKDHEDYRDSNTLADVEYRTAIIAKIALNNGHGTSEEIINSITNATGIEDNFILDAGNANANLYIRELLTPSDPRFYIIDQLVPRAAGVKLWKMYAHPLKIFGFIEQKVFFGFDIGVFVHYLEGEAPVVPPPFTPWDNNQSFWDNDQSRWDGMV